jgi:hypothetical protein
MTHGSASQCQTCWKAESSAAWCFYRITKIDGVPGRYRVMMAAKRLESDFGGVFKRSHICPINSPGHGGIIRLGSAQQYCFELSIPGARTEEHGGCVPAPRQEGRR